MTPRTRKIVGIVMIVLGAFLLMRGIENGLTVAPALAGTLPGTGENYAAGAIAATAILSVAGVGLIIYGLRIIKKTQQAPPA